jgi:uncharacterized protein (TIGR02001 family)
MFRKTLLALSVASAVTLPSLAHAQAAAPAAAASPHTFTGNMALVSDYRFRGITQTFAKPALQGGFDYSHSSGIYLGNWNSNISSGAGFPEGNLEMDFYGGWKKSWGDFGLDVGLLYYYYPGSNASTAQGTGIAPLKAGPANHTGRVDNKEVYIGGSWKFLSVKYFHSMGDYFSIPGTKNSNYLDFSASYDLGNGWGINGHVGSLNVKNNGSTNLTNAEYTDWKIGVTKDFSGWLVGASYIDTNAKGSCAGGVGGAASGFYCFGASLPAGAAPKGKDAGKGTLVLSVSKSF